MAVQTQGSLKHQTAGTMTGYLTQSHYPDALTSPCPILLMLNARLGSDKYQFAKLLAEIRTPNLPHTNHAINRFGHHVRSRSGMNCMQGWGFVRKSPPPEPEPNKIHL